MVKMPKFMVMVPNQDGSLVGYASDDFTETQRRAILHMVANVGVTPPAPATCGIEPGRVHYAQERVTEFLSNGSVVTESLLAPTKQQKYAAARSQGYTGDPCTTCQSMSVKRNGACLVCESCGSTTGCS